MKFTAESSATTVPSTPTSSDIQCCLSLMPIARADIVAE